MTTNERGFWQQVYAAAQAANHHDPKSAADKALADYRATFVPDRSYEQTQDRMAAADKRPETERVKWLDTADI